MIFSKETFFSQKDIASYIVLKTEKQVKEMLESLVTIINDKKRRVSSMITYQEILTLRWVLDDYEGWHDETFDFYKR
jgi:hypothetical protein